MDLKLELKEIANQAFDMTFIYKNQTKNKRGECINYLPKIIETKAYYRLLSTAFEKTDVRYYELCKTEWDTLKNPYLTVDELVDFYLKHPFWKKESFSLLHNYWLLYSGFTKACRENDSFDSKNIISTNAKTCLTSIQRIGKTLIVYQRSCDLSLGLFADAITINLIMQELNLVDIIWVIGIPHVYVNNIEKTVEYFKDVNMKRPKMHFNVRKENNHES